MFHSLAINLEAITAEVAKEPFKAVEQSGLHPFRWGDPRFPPPLLDNHSPGILISSWFKPGYESVAIQNGKHIIAIASFGNWLVNLPPVVEVK